MPGESWITHSVRIKGLDSFTTDAYEEGVHWLRQVLGRGGYTVAFIQPGMNFSMRTADNSSTLNSPVLVPPCMQTATRIATVRFQEGFATGFRRRTAASFSSRPQ